MDKLIIKNIKKFAYHGVYDTEKINGQEFLINTNIWIKEKKEYKILEDTVNYAECYKIIVEEFEKPRELLEDLSLSIINKLFLYNEKIKKVCIKIEKITPPVDGNLDSLGVKICRKR